MRLAGPVQFASGDPAEWVRAVQAKGYHAAYLPDAAAARPDEFAQAAIAARLVIAEVGAWSNPLASDSEERRLARARCCERLSLAERCGARCCVNIAGSRGSKWDGPDPRDLTAETFEMIVACVREIIDLVQPRRTFYTLETMPWMYPDSADSYLELLRAVDRRQFAVHFDPVNLISSPQRYFRNGDMIREFCAKLGPHLRSCHAKDILLQNKLTTHLDEVRPGLGGLDYRTFLSEVARLDPDLPVCLEHLPSDKEYDAAAAHIRSVAAELALGTI
jgi:sugar phosphate isomerase/epimerase